MTEVDALCQPVVRLVRTNAIDVSCRNRQVLSSLEDERKYFAIWCVLFRQSP